MGCGEKSGNHLGQRALSTAGFSDQSNCSAFPDGQINILKNIFPPGIRCCHILNVQDHLHFVSNGLFLTYTSDIEQFSGIFLFWFFEQLAGFTFFDKAAVA